MDFDLAGPEQALREEAAEFARREIAPRAAAHDAGGALDPELVRGLARAGFLGLLIPPAYGGGGATMLGFVAALEEIARACASTGALVALQNAVIAGALLRAGSEEQKRSMLPRLAKGEIIGSYAYAEPDVGSAVESVHLAAERAGEGYRLTGTKVFVAFGADAGVLVVLGRVEREPNGAVTAFLVDPAAGVAVRERVPTMGMRAIGLATLGFDGVRVPEASRLGGEGDGLAMLRTAIDDGRIAVAALAIGIADACREAAIDRARTRTQFGQVIGRFQAVQWLIADTATEVEAARLLTWHAASVRDAGERATDDMTEAAATAKLAASEAAVRAASRTMEVFGTWGYVAGTEVERHYRDAKATELLQGTTEIQKLAVARRLLETTA